LIDGSVEGLVQLDERKLTVGATAKVTADIIAREVIVYGTVKGNLRAKDRIEIKKDGSVNGDLTTARIMIEDGAYFKGSIEIDKSAEKESGSGHAFARSSSAPAAATATKTI
jgi:cytoskeletal protein CcmA (bactofilin family)